MTKDKDIKLSNVKGVLIFLVVFGHFLSSFQREYMDLYLFIYSFHMPLFVLISGYFAKRITGRKIINFLLLLAIFQPLYRGYLVLIGEEKAFALKPDLPYYHLWYLFAMTIWYIIAMGLNRLKLKDWHKVLIIVMFFAIGIGARFIADPFEAFIRSYGFKFKGTSFSYMRIMTFLPYFFIGNFLSKDNMVKLYSSLSNHKIIKIILLIGLYLSVMFFNPVNAEVIFKGKHGIAMMEGSLIFKTTCIIAGYIISLLMCFIMLNLLSDRKSIITQIGERTLPVYLFHAFIVIVLRDLEILHSLNVFILLPLLLLLSFLVVLLLENEIFIKLTYYLWNPLEFLRLVKEFIVSQSNKYRTKI